MNRIAKSDGLTLRKLGGVIISIGNRRCAIVSAVCTSSAAASILRLRSNWMMIAVVPCDEVDDIDEMPAMVESCRSIGPATDEAMVSALAPGRVAVTCDGREIDLRQRGNRQQPEAENAERDDRRRHQDRHDRPADTQLRQPHRLRPPPWPRAARPAFRPTAATVRRRRRPRRRSIRSQGRRCPGRCG